jgi:hypothetical protein
MRTTSSCLNSIKKRLEFPELKELAMEEYADWEPDAFIVEKKSSGVQRCIKRCGVWDYQCRNIPLTEDLVIN